MDVPLETLEYQLIEYGLQKRKLLGEPYLEVGCGDGYNLERFARRGMRGTGIDESHEAMEAAKAKKIPNTELREVDFMAYESSPWKLIFMLNILEHIEDDYTFIKQASTLLAAHGYLVIAAPTRQSAYGFADINAGHVRRYEEKDLREKLARAGFEVEEWKSVGFPVNRTYTWLFNALNRHRMHNTKTQTALSGIREKKGYYGGIYDIIAPFAFPILTVLIQLDRLFVNTKLGNNCVVFARKT